MQNPKITVLMPVYNAEEYVSEAINSILNQTFTNFEFIIIDDGSSDKSNKIIKQFKDKRIQIVTHEKNKGLIVSLNQGINLAKGTYIARMDSDDISLPTRLAQQYLFMEKNKKYIICGTAIQYFSPNKSFSHYLPNTHNEIYANLLFRSCIVHPSTMFRSHFFRENLVYYNQRFVHAEDYELWIRLITEGRFFNLQKILLKYRVHEKNISQRFQTTQIQNSKKVQKRQLQRLGIEPTEKELHFHYRLKRGGETITIEYLERINHWLLKLKKANDEKQIYPEPEFTEVLQEIWHQYTAGNSKLGLQFARLYAKSPLSQYQDWNLWNKNKFWIKSIFKIS